MRSFKVGSAKKLVPSRRSNPARRHPRAAASEDKSCDHDSCYRSWTRPRELMLANCESAA